MVTDLGLKRRKPQSPRAFGLLMALAAGGLGALLWWRGRPLAPYLIALAAVLGSLAVARPMWLKRTQSVWMRLAERLGRLMNGVLLSLFFLFLLTPFALVLRAVRRDRLGLRPSARQSYWEPIGQQDRPDYSRPF